MTLTSQSEAHLKDGLTMSKSLDNAGEVNPSVYQRDAWVYQLGRAPMQTAIDSAENIPVLRAYHMYGVFPIAYLQFLFLMLTTALLKSLR